MKKLLLSVISVILCLSLMVPAAVPAFAETTVEETVTDTTVNDALAGAGIDFESALGFVTDFADKFGDDFEALSSTSAKTVFMNCIAKVVNTLSNVLITVIGRVLNLFIPSTPALNSYKDFNIDEYGNFYAGMDEFLDEPAAGARWSLGYAQESILPDDFGTVPYTMGGYGLMAETTETFDGLWVRTIVLDDGSGRGKVAFCVLDAIGIANADVRLIRAAVADFAEANDIVSINVSVTHTHSGIDLQGVWDNTVNNVLNNITLGALGLADLQSGVDRKFLQTIIDQTAKSIKDATADMKTGELTLATMDIGDHYLRDRTYPDNYDGNMYRLEFTPDKKGATPTIIATFGVHPENSGFGHTVISADFIPYTEEVLNAAGYNFIFIQGMVGTITYDRHYSNDGLDLTRYEEAVRYGWEIGYFLLGMELTEAECKALNFELGDFLDVAKYEGQENYTVWYEGWTPVEEEPVKPLLNIKHMQYVIEVSNVLLDIIGKSGITDYFFLYDSSTGKYYEVTECGYMELGDSLKVLISPGEHYGEMLKGGKGLEGFEYDCYRDMFGENTIIFDLANDAIGYIEPDQEFVMAGMKYDEKDDEFDTDTWCLISFGEHTASNVAGKFVELYESVR
ncbi:MAG: neutral/alkaline non-lysosomal ceramidase N-terminal domain-containing protein [Clostridia bacterium]|nr:neutral/alkaline non-lysosomal ceramidase N-terminal domain-containing protein [Clostridia bacterium]